MSNGLKIVVGISAVALIAVGILIGVSFARVNSAAAAEPASVDAAIGSLTSNQPVAQTTAEPNGPNGPYGNGACPMHGGEGGYGPMSAYRDQMHTAIAAALGLTLDEYNAKLAEGLTPFEIAEAQGVDAETFQAAWLDAHEAALAQAVADGVMTQEQADWMLAHMQRHLENGFGPGMMGGWGNGSNGPQGNAQGWGGPGRGMMGGGGMMGWGWNQQATQEP